MLQKLDYLWIELKRGCQVREPTIPGRYLLQAFASGFLREDSENRIKSVFMTQLLRPWRSLLKIKPPIRSVALYQDQGKLLSKIAQSRFRVLAHLYKHVKLNC